jgi:hypothetical protein
MLEKTVHLAGGDSFAALRCNFLHQFQQ